MQLCVAVLLPCCPPLKQFTFYLIFQNLFLTGSKTFNNCTHAVRFGHASTTGFHKKVYLTHLSTRFQLNYIHACIHSKSYVKSIWWVSWETNLWPWPC